MEAIFWLRYFYSTIQTLILIWFLPQQARNLSSVRRARPRLHGMTTWRSTALSTSTPRAPRAPFAANYSLRRRACASTSRPSTPPQPPPRRLAELLQGRRFSSRLTLHSFMQRVAAPDPGSDAFLMAKIRIRIRDEQPGSYFREVGDNFLG